MYCASSEAFALYSGTPPALTASAFAVDALTAASTPSRGRGLISETIGTPRISVIVGLRVFFGVNLRSAASLV